MLRLAKWGGLVTAASPYAIPPGGAARQCNFTLTTPGQLTSRAGMQELTQLAIGGSVPGMIEQMWPISGGVGRGDKVVVLDDAGNLSIIDGVTL